MNAKFYFIGVVILVAFVGIYLTTQNGLGDRSAPNELTPEKNITHGHGLVVDTANPQNLYIATHHGLLVLKNERDLYRIGKSHDDYMGFTKHPENPTLFYSSGHSKEGGNLGFQKSEDGGFTWEKVSPGVNGPVDFHAMTVSPVKPNIFYGWYRGALQRSIDAGQTWEIVNNDLTIVYLVADSQDENTVYAATPEGKGVLVSHDKGATWASVSKDLEGGQVSVFAVHPKNVQEFLVFSEKLGGLGKSIDGGATWKTLNESFNNETVLYIAFDKQNPDIIYLLTHTNAIYKSQDSGETWIHLY